MVYWIAGNIENNAQTMNDNTEKLQKILANYVLQLRIT